MFTCTNRNNRSTNRAKKYVMENKIEILSKKCLNSRYVAHGLEDKKEEGCECICECKVLVELTFNGHAPYKYVMAVSEFKNWYQTINGEKYESNGKDN